MTLRAAFSALLILVCHPGFAHAETAFRSRGNTFNPDLSVSTLLLYQNSNRGNTPTSEPPNGLDIQEVEIQFTADVDPYSRLVAIFGLHPEVEISSGSHGHAHRSYHFEPEEVYAESLALPLVTLRAGKFKTAFGRHNLLHTHDYPFIDAPLLQDELLGSEGLNDTGLSASLLLPAPWFSEVTVQGLAGHAEDVFGSPHPNSAAGLAHIKNLWDLSEATTLQLGLSGASGKNEENGAAHLWGADLTVKWRPLVGGTRRALVWTSEFIAKESHEEGSLWRGRGFVSFVQYQFAQRWWLQSRGEYLKLNSSDPADPTHEVKQKQSVLVAFLPSEFSGFRLQYDHLRDDQLKDEHKLSLQMSFSIGAHPAHLY